MQTEDSAYFQLSIWQPANICRRLDYAEGLAVSFEPSKLLEEVYCWQTSADPFGSIVDADLVRELRALLDAFSPTLRPEARSMTIFIEMVRNLQVSFQKPNVCVWAELTQSVKIGVFDSINLRSNISLAVVNHLAWVARAFEFLPFASVTIR